MKLKDIVDIIKRPFILVDPNEAIDYKAVQLMVRVNNSYYVGHNIHGITEDIINREPNDMEREIDYITAIRYMPETPTVVIKLKK